MQKLEIHAVAAAAVVLGISAAFLDWFSLNPNRLVSGQGLGFFESLGLVLGTLLLGSWVVILSIAAIRKSWSKYAYPVLFFVVLFEVIGGSGLAATRHLSGAGVLSRVSLSGGFWLSLLAVYLLYFVSTRKGHPFSSLVTMLGPLAVLAILASGWCDGLSVIVEFNAQRTRFVAELWRHLSIFGVSLAAATVIGIPLGIWISKGSKAARPILWFLGIVETVPSLALFGLLLVTLAAIRDLLPALGISAIGFLPAVIAITLYALLPIVQNTYTGIRSVANEICDAGFGVGMSRFQLLSNVELPLAAPAIVSGLRIAAIQAVGGTTVAALIGAGGLGFFILQGLGQAASDLILLGALSVTIMALVVNAFFQFIEDRLSPGQVAAA
ncbi:ABC transporter permease [Dehalogenimonas etheniformans]|uniref:ABC transporter permease n=1 Tax=Dehalogenimonas etheniformans TaxID=1536648 RepID=A0A2P5P891_9CHLR|nr:ABC transporter permease [Dehalogenimonas etheniformans]PPD58511.1 ABC transporter permease [Dehalogenimonas etheniformans]QNT76725.1 ABC transporter permease [Dehalogenimonas etheniformans]